MRPCVYARVSARACEVVVVRVAVRVAVRVLVACVELCVMDGSEVVSNQLTRK